MCDSTTAFSTLAARTDFALFQVPNDTRRLDKRENCIYIETCQSARHYLAFDTQQMLDNFEMSYHKCIYNTVTNMQVAQTKLKFTILTLDKNFCL